MKKFIKKTIIFALPLMVFLIDGFLPINTFTYRVWEALLYKNWNEFAYPFYQNQKIDMYTTGDLAHHTKHAILKREYWVTDKLGYRNDTFIKKPKILIIGDSFIAGTGLTQDSTLTNLLKNKLNTQVYSIAPANFSNFISLYKNQNIIEKPEVIVFSIVEREIPPPIYIYPDDKIIRNISKPSILKDRLTRFYFFKYIKARILNEHGFGVQGETDTTMFFLNGKNQQYFFDKIDIISKTIISYKNYCDSIGVEFIFLPLPNKETVYFDKVPFDNQPDYIFKLNSILEKNGVITVNTVSLFNNAKTKNNHYLYHADDTHWNSNGVNLVADELIKKIKINRQIQ